VSLPGQVRVGGPELDRDVLVAAQSAAVSVRERPATDGTAQAFAASFVESLTWPDPVVDAPEALRTSSWQLAFERAQCHVQEYNAATWTATMNIQNRIAPATIQVLERWATTESIVSGARPSKPVHTQCPRSRRRRVQIWKKRWGLRWGKMVIRDVFGDSELYTKAGPLVASRTWR